MKEQQLQTKVIQALKKQGAWVFNPLAGAGGAGIPDLLVGYAGYLIAMELKGPDGSYKPTFVQKQQLDHITRTGNIGAIVQSVDFALAILDALDRGDTDWIYTHGYQSHGTKEMLNDAWLEECLW